MKKHRLKIALSIILLLLPLWAISQQILWQPQTLSIGASAFTLAFSSDSQTLIVSRKIARGGFSQNFQLWGVSSGELQKTLPETRSSLAIAAISPNEKMVAGAVGVGSVKLWDAHSGKVLHTFSKPLPTRRTTTSIAFSPNNKVLAEGRGDGGGYVTRYPGMVLLWDIKTGELLRTISTGGNSVYSFFFTPDGKMLVGSGLYAVQIWNLQTGSLLWKLKHGTLLGPNLTFSNDGKTLVTLDNPKTVVLRDVTTGNVKRKFKEDNGRISTLAFAPDGKKLAVVSNETGIPAPPPGATAFGYEGPGVPVNGEVKLWDSQTGGLLHVFKNGGKPFSAVAFAPDGQMLAVGSEGEVIIWDVQTGKLLRKLTGPSKTINSLVFAPDGHTLATGSEDQTVKLWRIK